MTNNEEESKGLGDTVEKIISQIGDVTKIEYIRRKKNCEGCRKRKEWLNKQFPYSTEQVQSEPVKKEGCKSCGQKKSDCKNCNK
jgi:hypothetical protein